MANYKISFLGTVKDCNNELQCYVNVDNNIFISIEDPESEYFSSWISLDIPTAIKFAKRLRTVINEAKSYENE